MDESSETSALLGRRGEERKVKGGRGDEERREERNWTKRRGRKGDERRREERKEKEKARQWMNEGKDKLNKYGMNHKRKGGIKECGERNSRENVNRGC